MISTGTYRNGRIKLRHGHLDEAGIAALAATYDARKGRDREKLDAMIACAASHDTLRREPLRSALDRRIYEKPCPERA